MKHKIISTIGFYIFLTLFTLYGLYLGFIADDRASPNIQTGEIIMYYDENNQSKYMGKIEITERSNDNIQILVYDMERTEAD